MRSHLQIFTQFRNDLGVTQFPVEGTTMFCYIAFLATTGRSYGTIKKHISSVKHFHRLFGQPPLVG